jgi:hypothetical protein
VAEATPPQPWQPLEHPSVVERTLASASERARLARSVGLAALRALANPATAGEGVAELRRIASVLTAVGTPAPVTLLNRQLGRRRSVAFAELSFHLAKELAARRGATVDDVVLTTAALALGNYLRRAGESHPWLRVVLPVDVAAACGAKGRLSVTVLELPTGERDPETALAEVCRQTGEHRRSDQPGAVDGLVRAAEHAPARMRDVAAWMASRAQTFNVAIVGVPGPPGPLFLLGRRVRAAYPAVQLAQGHGVSIGVLAYDGSLHIGLYSDPDVVPDLVELARDFTSSFDALRLALLPGAPSAPAPPRRRHRPVPA